MKKQYMVIIAVVLCMIVLATGYNIFRTNVDVKKNTAPAKYMEVIFSKTGVIEEFNSTGASAVISRDRKNVTISAPNLMVKGAYAKFPITVKNIGTVPVRLRHINQVSYSNFNAISVKYEGIAVTDQVFYPGDEKDFTVLVKWTGELYNQTDNLSFIISFNYIQVK